MTMIRPASEADADQLANILNAIIAEGGRTAIAEPLAPRELVEWFISGPHCVSCLIALDGDGRTLGFQTTERFHDDLPPAVADIGTFIAAGARGRGVGRQLADATFSAAGAAGIAVLRAVIRRENTDAMAYYRAIGFRGGSGGDGSAVLICDLG